MVKPTASPSRRSPRLEALRRAMAPPPRAEVGTPAPWTGNLLRRFPADFAGATPAVTTAIAPAVTNAAAAAVTHAPSAPASASAPSTSSAPSDSGGPAATASTAQAAAFAQPTAATVARLRRRHAKKK
uniref:Antifreeze glycoprotein n=1 Tax=Steinernema glaseri TaxID=37863 RepID=A0A1I8AHZ4_9BILA